MSEPSDPSVFALPRRLRENGERWLAGEVAEVATPRPAATVMLVRDALDGEAAGDRADGSATAGTAAVGGGRGCGCGCGDSLGSDGSGGSGASGDSGSSSSTGASDSDSSGPSGESGGSGDVQVWVMRRVASMAFAPDVTVFPGGGVDLRDDDPHLPWRCPGPAAWADVLGVSESLARQLVVAAAREVFEECGLLLAADPDGRPPEVGAEVGGAVGAEVGGADWAAARAALVRRETAFAHVLESRGLALRTDLLRARARWVTPEFEPRRYDTFFFLARVPSGQQPDGLTSEAQTAGWVRPAQLLAQHAAGEVTLLPPTIDQTRRLAAGGGVARLMAQEPQRPLPRVLPVPVRRDGDVVLVCEGIS